MAGQISRGCQKDIAEQIVEQKGDYLLALKGNQGHLAEDVEALFDWARKRRLKAGWSEPYLLKVLSGLAA